MGRDARQLLIGSAALPEEREALERAIEEFDEVDAVKELLTMVLGPNAFAGRPEPTIATTSTAIESSGPRPRSTIGCARWSRT